MKCYIGIIGFIWIHLVHLPVAALWYGQLDNCHGDTPFLVGDRPEGTSRNVGGQRPAQHSHRLVEKRSLEACPFVSLGCCAWFFCRRLVQDFQHRPYFPPRFGLRCCTPTSPFPFLSFVHGGCWRFECCKRKVSHLDPQMTEAVLSFQRFVDFDFWLQLRSMAIFSAFDSCRVAPFRSLSIWV